MIKIRCLFNNSFSGTFSGVTPQTIDVNVCREAYYKTLLNCNSVIKLQLSRSGLLTECLTVCPFTDHKMNKHFMPVACD